VICELDMIGRRLARFASAAADRLRNQARGGLTAVRSHPYPLVVSFWLAVVFTERLVVDQMAHRDGVSFGSALASTSTVFCLLVTWLFALVSLLIDREAIANTLSGVRRFRERVLREVLSPLPILLVSLLMFIGVLARGAVKTQSMSATIAEWAKAVSQQLAELRPALILAAVVTLVYFIWYVVYRYLRRRIARVEEAIHETIVGSFFVLANAATYMWLYAMAVIRLLPSTATADAVGGLLKDTLIYSLVWLAVVLGTYKAEETLRRLDRDVHRWMLLAVMGFGTMFCAVPAIALDLNFKDNILLAGKSTEYPAPWQQALVAAHIWLRDFGLLVPLLVVAFLRFFKEVERINLEARRSRR